MTVRRSPPPVEAADDRRPEDVALGTAAIAFRLGAGVGRVVLYPGRLLARSFLVQPVVHGAADGLAAAGREAEAAGRRRLEATAAEIIAAPETARTVERALAEPVPDAADGEVIERLAQRVLESPTFERVVRDAAESRIVQELIDEAVHSEEMQRMVEEVLAGPAMQRALSRQTMTLWTEVTARLRSATRQLDDRLGRVPSSVEAQRYGGLAGRGVAFLADTAITQLTALVVGSLVGLVASLIGISASGWLVGAIAAAAWALFVGGYFVFFWATVGQTPGMRVMGLRVVRPDGHTPRVGRSLVRLVGLALAIAPLFAGFLPVLVDRRRRALQDFLAKTVVVLEDPA